MKPLFVISSPFDTYSGYGARSRDLIKAIIETDKYKEVLEQIRLGNYKEYILYNLIFLHIHKNQIN